MTQITIKAEKEILNEMIDVYGQFLTETFDSYSETGEEPEECHGVLVDACTVVLNITPEHWANLSDILDSYEFDYLIKTTKLGEKS